MISGNGNGSLKDFGIKFDKIELCDGKINLSEICKYLEITQPKLIYFQRSRGYSWRNALTIDDFGNAVNVIKKISPDSLIMVDNCYGEFTEECEPTVCGADIIAGSLIKNAGGRSGADRRIHRRKKKNWWSFAAKADYTRPREARSARMKTDTEIFIKVFFSRRIRWRKL